MDAGVTPAQAGLGWSIPKVRRTGGERDGGFPGAAAILPELGLRLYQQPSGADIGAMGSSLREGALQAALAGEGGHHRGDPERLAPPSGA